MSGGTLNFAGGNNTLTINLANGADMIGSVIKGTAGLTISGSGGILVLTGANTYSGGTTISAAGTTLQVGLGGTTGSLGSGNVTINGAGTGYLGFDRSDAITVANAISGTGNLTQQGTGTLTLTGNNTYSGATTLEAGILNVGSSGALGSSGVLDFTGGTLQYGAANQTDYSARFYSAPGLAYKIDTNGQAVTFASALTGSGSTLTKLGTGTLTLTGANTYSGGTTISGGTLQIGNGGPTGSLGSGNVTNNAALAFNLSSATTAANAISGTGSVAQAGTGTLTLTGSNTYSGGTTISAGTLYANNATNSLGTGAVSVTGGTLAGSGTIAPSSGKAVTVSSGATLAPGAAAATGILTIGTAGSTNNVTLSSGSTLSERLDGNAAGNGSAAGGYDQLNVLGNGTITVSGSTLSLVLGGGYTPAGGYNSTTHTGGDVLILVNNQTGHAIASTFNGIAQDGTVNLGAYTAQLSYTGSTASAAVDGTGYSIVLYNFTPVPEPSTVLAIGAAGLALTGWVRRRRTAAVTGA